VASTASSELHLLPVYAEKEKARPSNRQFDEMFRVAGNKFCLAMTSAPKRHMLPPFQDAGHGQHG
jgi:hypothetical protein